MDTQHNTMITSTNSTPLYIQLAQKLQEEILQLVYTPGSKLPTEHELSRTYHVSRVTVRKALQILEDQEYIDRKVGKGTYVAEKKLQRNVTDHVSSFTLMCEETGMQASAQMIRMDVLPADTKQQKLMQLATDQQILYIERIRYADGQPVLIERDIFPEDFRFLFSENLEKNSIFALIRQKRKIIYSRAERTIDIVFANASEARMLGLKTGYPLLRICSTTTDDTGTHITLSEQLYIGDKFKLKV